MIRENKTPILISVLLFAVLLSFSATTDTVAQSRVCRNLQAQLTATSRGGGSSAAVKSQLAQAQRLANQKRCGALFGQRSKECQAINAKIGQLTKQLRGGGGGSAQEKRQIMAAMKANGCGKKATKKTVKREAPAKRQAAKPSPAKPKTAAKPKAPVKPKATAKPKASAERQAPAAKQQADARPKVAALAKVPTGAISGHSSSSSSLSSSASKARRRIFSGSGTYRTMCVRLSDGYYFPISFSVPVKFFERDAETCQSRCAGMDVALYVHRPGEDSEEMVSYPDQQPYSDLGTAFLYRHTSGRSQAIACRPAVEEAVEEAVKETVKEAPVGASPIMAFNGEVPIPTPRPSLEETSSVNAGPEEMLQISAVPGPVPDERKDVRTVGPRFLPDPSEELDLIGPARPLGL